MESSTPSLVGRSSEIESVDYAVAGLAQGRGQVLLLVGEPGIGKSTLARYAAGVAKENGAEVYWGFAWEAGGAPAYWPWTQLLRSLIANRDLSEPEKASLARLLPEFAGPASPGEDLRPDQVRFQLLDAVRLLLARLAARDPLVLIFEDLHAADRDSLNLLRHIGRHVGVLPILIIGTYRELEARSSAEADPLWALGRDALVLSLPRLAEQDVSRYLHMRTGSAPNGSELRQWFETTAGNPLFLSELAALQSSTHNSMEDLVRGSGHGPGQLRATLPATVEQVIRQQVDRLPVTTARLLSQASVLGKRFDGDTLAGMLSKPGPEIERILDAALAAGILHQVSPGAFEFSHGLYRDVLYGTLTAEERASLHLAQARVLQKRIAQGDVDVWAELARHLAAAGIEHRAQAIEAWRCAASRASERLAFDEAAALLTTALHAFGEGPKFDPAHRCRLLLDCAQAMLLAGDIDSGRSRCLDAFAIARTLEDPGLMTRAALTYGSAIVVASVDPELIDMLRQCLDALPKKDVPSRARALARLAAALQPAANPAEPMAMAREAIEQARASGDEGLLYDVLRHAISALMDFAPPAERQALNREVLSLARARGDVPLQFRCNLRLMIDAAEQADRPAFDQAIDACERIANRIALPHYQWRVASARAMQATIEGRYSEAMRLLDRAQQLAERIEDLESRVTIPIQRFAILCDWDSDQAPPLEDIQAALDEAYADGLEEARFYVQPRIAAFTITCAEEAKALIAAPGLVERTFAGGDRFSLVVVAELARLAGDLPLSRRAFDALKAHRRGCAVAGLLGSIWAGPVALELGQTAMALGRLDEARELLDSALDSVTRMGSRPQLARVHATLAELASKTGDEAAAVSHSNTASKLLGALGMRRQRGARSAGDPTAQAPAAPGADFSIEAEGEACRVSLNGQSALVKHTKGIAMLAALVSRPDTDIHVLELSGIEAGQASPEEGTGPALDRAARDAYKRRVAELREQLEEAESLGDTARAEEAREELELISRELSRAFGLGGRQRPQGARAERARVNVRRRIKDAIDRIEEQLPGAGRYLENAVKTGSYCRYSPM